MLEFVIVVSHVFIGKEVAWFLLQAKLAHCGMHTPFVLSTFLPLCIYARNDVIVYVCVYTMIRASMRRRTGWAILRLESEVIMIIIYQHH